MLADGARPRPGRDLDAMIMAAVAAVAALVKLL